MTMPEMHAATCMPRRAAKRVRQSSATCRNGTSTTSTSASNDPALEARSRRSPKAARSDSRRASRASSSTWRRRPTPASGSPRPWSPSRSWKNCSAASSRSPASSTPATPAIPSRSKFYGDVQEKITAASSHLLFFALELNRIDDAALEAAMADPALGHYRPWIEDVRAEKPYQLEDRVELLFHEKSVTGRGAWNRLFDETMAALRFDVDGEELAIEPTLNLLQDRDEAKRKAAAEALAVDLQEEHPPLHPHHQHARQGQGNLRPLARLQGRRRRRATLSNRVEPEVVDALVAAVRAAYPRLSHRYYKLKAQVVRARYAQPLGPQRAAARGAAETIPFAEARATVLGAYGAVLAGDGDDRRAASSTSAGSMRRSGRARRRAPSRIRPCRRRTRMCSSTIRARCAT